MDNRKYICISDLQGGNFAVGSIDTIEEWRERALDWCETDNNMELFAELEKVNKKEVIDFISEIWELEFAEINNMVSDILFEVKEQIEYYAGKYDEIWNEKENYFDSDNEQQKYYKGIIRELENVVDIIYDKLRIKEGNKIGRISNSRI